MHLWARSKFCRCLNKSYVAVNVTQAFQRSNRKNELDSLCLLLLVYAQTIKFHKCNFPHWRVLLLMCNLHRHLNVLDHCRVFGL